MNTHRARLLVLANAAVAESELARLGRSGGGAWAPTVALKLTDVRRRDVAPLRSAARRAGVQLVLSVDGTAVLLAAPRPALAALAEALDAPLGSTLRRVLAASTAIEPPETPCGPTTLIWGQRTYIMGIINMTPDSFSGDGLGADVETALAIGRRMVAEGADILDVGGESSRPPHTYGERPAVPAAEELRRVVPAVRRLAQELRVPISIDTTKPEVARAALDAGAAMINDVWGIAAHPEMLALAAERRVPIVLMHNQVKPEYDDLMAAIVGGLERAVERALAAGIAPWQIIVDPGFGFGKTPADNLELTARLGELRALGRPILYGSSRKSTIGVVLGGLPPTERVEGTGATIALAIANGADIVRVHDVAHMARVARLADAVVRGPWSRATTSPSSSAAMARPAEKLFG